MFSGLGEEQSLASPLGVIDHEAASDSPPNHLEAVEAGISNVVFWAAMPCRDGFELLPELWQPGRGSRHQNIAQSHPAEPLLQARPMTTSHRLGSIAGTSRMSSLARERAVDQGGMLLRLI